MALTKQQIANLKGNIEYTQVVLNATDHGDKTRRRRPLDDAEKMRAYIIASRAKGVTPRQHAEKCSVSRAYIYMIKE